MLATYAKLAGTAVLIAAFVMLQCSSTTKTGDVGQTVATSAPGQPTTAPAAAAAHKAGDTVTIGNGATMTIESVNRTGEGDVVAVVVVDNGAGTEALSLSSMLSFEARDEAGNKGTYALQMTPPEGANTPIDGEVAPGDKLRGYVAFGGLGPGVKLTYATSIIGGEKVAWDLGQ
jgi:hypothetical protein